MNSSINQRYATELAEESNIAEIASAGSLWQAMRQEVKARAEFEPIMATYFQATVLNHDTLEGSLSFLLASKLDSSVVSSMALREIIQDAFVNEASLTRAAEIDIKATRERDPACNSYSTPFLFYKGFQALQIHRVAHWLWTQERHSLAFFLQNQVSTIFGVDIHPAARIGCGIMLDHATGLVIGETAIVEDDVSILHGVTLGGTGKESGDRHPKVRCGVMIGANASIIGNLEIGEGAKVGAGSVVMKDVPAHVTVAGIPAKIIGMPNQECDGRDMEQCFFD
ncbi:MAG: serine O-acetyltransferase [Pseudomonadales bacterium]|jgi:serine O-acetyltransferase|nr:serine O-acetyltransferase [Pseudomonadales bacterium]MDG1442234.1 serine O-acetyltransferase [Pseudomonadales bacterium]